MQIEVDCERIRRNTEAIVRLCKPQGIEVVGATKACCGHPDVARAMLAGGATILAESRLRHVRRLRDAGIDSDIMMLRLPAPSEASEAAVAMPSTISARNQKARYRRKKGVLAGHPA